MKNILFIAIGVIALVIGCKTMQESSVPTVDITSLSAEKATEIAQKIESEVKPDLADGLTLDVWASDSLVMNAIALSFDNQGRAYVASTHRSGKSEFDIRGHRDWMTDAISFQTVEDRRAFLHKVFDPANSDISKQWLDDLNQDSIVDWQDLRVPKENVLRIEDRDNDGLADHSQVFATGFNDEVADVMLGVLPYGDEVFACIAPDVWRLKDTDGDGQADEQESISHGYGVHIGFGGHGMSGMTVGPDGKVYWGIGDIGANVVDKQGKRWKYPNQGVICRSNPDGSDFEVFAAGVRNTHEFVFDDYGNLIAADNDGDHPGEMERLLYVVNGSDSGWRINWQFGKYTDPDNNTYKVWMDEEMFKPRHEGQAAYFLPPLRNYHSGPSGMKYNPGTALNEDWKNKFFLVEFVGSPSNSKLWSFELAPKGAGFDFVEEEKIVSGILPVGIDFGPDGALYMTDWIDGWGTTEQGRIWKMDVATNPNPLRAATKMLLAASFKEKGNDELGELLKHADKRVRQKAQFELAKRDQEGYQTLLAAAQQTEHQLARIHGIWGIGQLCRTVSVDFARALPKFLEDDDPEIVAQAAKLIGDIRYQPPVFELIALLKHESDRVKFFAMEALGRVAYPKAVDPILEMLIKDDGKDTYLRHGGMVALGRIGEAAPLIALKDHPSKSARIIAVVALRRMQHEGVAEFLKDEDEYIVAEAARAINDDWSIEAALPALAEVLKETRFTSEPLLRRAINANSRVGKAENIEILKDFAIRKNAPAKMRAEALATLSVWANPSVLDRVDGRFRGASQREATPVVAALEPIMKNLLAENNPAIQVATAKAGGKLQIKSITPTLAALAKGNRNADVRVAALKALNDLDAPELDGVLEVALADKESSVRSTALSIIPNSNLEENRAVELFAKVLENGTIREQQATLTALGAFKGTTAIALLSSKMEALLASQLTPSIQLDLMEAVEATGNEKLLAQLNTYHDSKPADDLIAQFQECLEGGDENVGRNIMRWNQTAQCMRCHAVFEWGGDVGPNLAAIGAKYDKRELLESVIDPSAKIAMGYGVATLTLNNDEVVGGIVEAEDATSITLKLGKSESRTISKMDIKERIDAVSSMPSIKDKLSKRQIRDLVAYLTTLKGHEG